MLLKLPEWIVNRWNRQVAICRENEKRFPSFKEFMQFMIKEAKIACDPVTSLQALKSGQTCSNTESKKISNDQELIQSDPISEPINF